MNREILVAAMSGALFGLGLVVSSMIDPARVLGFLDVLGAWDPTLAFVMAGALAPMAVAWRIVARREDRTVFGGKVHRPTKRSVDAGLIAGAVLFGIGWGLVGLCPGPAVAAITIAGPSVWIFVAAMLAGMAAFRIVAKA